MDQRTFLLEDQKTSCIPLQARDGTTSQTSTSRTDNEAKNDVVIVLGERLHQEITRMQKAARRSRWFYWLYQAAPLVALVIFPTLLGEERGQAMARAVNNLVHHPTAVVCWSVIVVSLLRYYIGARRWNRCKRLADTLAGHDDVRAVGPLIETLTQDYKIKTVKEPLTRLLSRLQPEDAFRLNADQRKLLCSRLEASLPKTAINARATVQEEHRREMSFRLAILQTFGQIGEKSVLPTIEKLSNSEAKTAYQRRIKEAAQEVLPLIQQRIEQQTNAQTLLRAANGSVADAETLLRAAQGSTETPSNQLLRPHK